MSKSQKELAFLRDLYISNDWTNRFTDLVGQHLKFPKTGKFLYFNADTGNYALALREKLNRNVELICVCETAEIQKIAKAKAEAVKSDISFQTLENLESEDFDYVLGDLSFTAPDKINGILDEFVYLTIPKGKIAFFAPTAGSFGEIYSYLWETFLDVGLIEQSGEIERLIQQIPSISQLEDAAKDAGLKNVESETSREVFEYESSKEFAESSLAANFLIPVWLDFLSEKDRKKAVKQLVQIIDNDLEGLNFRFSVKAVLVTGEKGYK